MVFVMLPRLLLWLLKLVKPLFVSGAAIGTLLSYVMLLLSSQSIGEVVEAGGWIGWDWIGFVPLKSTAQ